MKQGPITPVRHLPVFRGNGEGYGQHTAIGYSSGPGDFGLIGSYVWQTAENKCLSNLKDFLFPIVCISLYAHRSQRTGPPSLSQI